MSEPVTLVLLATAWGPRFGGINAFNVELARSLGILPGRQFDLVCVVPQATESELDDARRHCVKLQALNLVNADLPAAMAEQMLAALALDNDTTAVWVGHDDKTGPLALALRQAKSGSRAVLIHHMAFSAYQDHKKGNSTDALAKAELQRELFGQADLCLAVGPMLWDQLADLLQSSPHTPAIEMIVPGLAEPDPTTIALSDAPPHNFTAFLAGRLGSDDERIKQPMLGVRAFGAAVGHAFKHEDTGHPIRRSPTLRMRGVPDDQHEEVRQAVQAAGGHAANCQLSGFNEDRAAYFSALASSSVAMMPSWHEGFGLTAWEAIACQVPVVLGEQSGVYRLLNENCQGMGLNRSVRSIAIQGQADLTAENAHTEEDLRAMRDALLKVGGTIHTAKTQATELATLLRRDMRFTWQRCAADMMSAIEQHLALAMLLAKPAPSSAAASLPVFSRAPAQPADEARPPEWLLPPRPRLPQPGLGLAPSALLRARDQVVGFHPERQPLVAGWLAEMQRAEQPRITLRLVTGPGGMGKTRSALELAAQAKAAGWQALWLPEALPEGAAAAWKLHLQQANRPLLLVLDYAEGRQPTLLNWLEAALNEWRHTPAQTQNRLHLLCLARQGDWWAELPRHPSCTEDIANLLAGPANLGSQAMPAWRDDTDARASAYQAAVKAYAQAQGLQAPANTWQPDWRSNAFGRPLYLHLAALAALSGERPHHAHQLLQGQLDREWRFWQRHAQAAGAVSHADWADALAWLALVQGASQAELTAASLALGISDPEGLVQHLQAIYQDEHSQLAPLQPDLLAEAMVIERAGQPRGAQLLALALPNDEPEVTTRTLEVLARLAVQRPDPSLAIELLHQWERTVIAALAQAWPAHGDLFITITHNGAPRLSSWLDAAWQALPAHRQQELAGRLRLPHYSTPLLKLAVEVARAAVHIANPGAERASTLNTLANRLSAQGDADSRSEALVCSREAVSICRDLVHTQPTAYLPALAGSLQNLANHLSDRGDAASRSEALDCAREAVSIHRDLALTQPAEHLPDFAGSLHNLANHLAERGDTAACTEALACVRAAVSIRRDLAQAQPATYLPDLAMSLNNLANRLADRGDADSRAEVLAYARAAVSIRRDLAQAQPAVYLPALAISLNNLAKHLSEQGDVTSRAEALACGREALSTYRTLSQTQSAPHLPGLAMSLHNLAKYLADQGDAHSRAEALACAREAVTVYRALAQAQPTAYLPDLAMSINNLANHLADQGHATSRTEALVCAREALLLCGAAYFDMPAAHQRRFEVATHTLARISTALGLDPEQEWRTALAPLQPEPGKGEDADLD
ncbi:MAG TPA: glycosyltransferase [Ideonella sp.]|uniref:glycosyltransferase n=1 Tax=Ideonella sp. TaxID=1929293 RepID=UPI002CCDF644|nr:glycosyltransferase [Ideonella sp.]HSI52281.1 glycosyltransferase [Ideonella sp.]